VNIEKMHNGTPLTDDDRKPWLAAIAKWIDQIRRRGDHAVIACSALKRRYREVLIGDRADVRLVYLKGDEALIARRIASGNITERVNLFMPAFSSQRPRGTPIQSRRNLLTASIPNQARTVDSLSRNPIHRTSERKAKATGGSSSQLER
jgi:carbohydrate kinase (thermoresistant glucokinase family)